MSKTKYFAVVTDLGNELMMQAVADGKKVGISLFAVGDGSGAYYEPTTDMIQLKSEKWRGDINDCRISKESENVLIVSAICPGDIGGFTIREMAVFDEENNMIAICNTPDTPKVKITDGVVNEMRLELEIILINGTSVELVIDPNIVTATKKDVEEVWDYLKETGKTIVGVKDTEIMDNDICIIVDEVLWPKKKSYLLFSNNIEIIMKSENGTVWKKVKNQIVDPKSVAYGNHHFVYIKNGNIVHVSEFGEEWLEATKSELVSGENVSLIYGLNSFICIGHKGKTYRSMDGEIWRKTKGFTSKSYESSLAHGNKMVIATCRDGIFTTVDGEKWVTVNSAYSYNEPSIAFANGMFAHARLSDMDKKESELRYSENGEVWPVAGISPFQLRRIISANNRFFGLPESSRSNKVLISFDSKKWDEIELEGMEENTGKIEGIYYLDNKYYCIKGNNIYTSSNHIKWEKQLQSVQAGAEMIWNF